MSKDMAWAKVDILYGSIKGWFRDMPSQVFFFPSFAVSQMYGLEDDKLRVFFALLLSFLLEYDHGMKGNGVNMRNFQGTGFDGRSSN